MSLRDEMLKIVGNDCVVDDAIHCPPRGEVPSCYECKVDRILSLQDSGHRLLIGKVEGELPGNPFEFRDGTGRWLATSNAQIEMLKEGWVKEVRE